MSNICKKSIHFLLLLCLINTVLKSQVTADSIGLPSDNLIVNKQVTINPIEFAPVAFPMIELPSQNVVSKKQIDFSEYNYDFELESPKLRPIRYRLPNKIKGRDGWLSLAGGSPNYYLADVGYDYSITDWYGIQASFFYDRANDKSKKNTHFQNIHSTLAGHYFLAKKHKIIGSLNYTNDLQGLRSTLNPTELNDPDRNTNVIEGKMGFYGSPYKDYGFNYALQFGYKNFVILNENISENEVFISGNVYKKLFNRFGLALTSNLYGSNTIIQNSFNLNRLFTVKPMLHYNNSTIDIELGLLYAYHPESHYNPWINIKYRFDKIPLTLEAFAKSEVSIQSIHQIHTSNYFVEFNQGKRPILSEDSYGIKAKYNWNKIQINPHISYDFVENEIIFPLNNLDYLFSEQSVDFNRLTMKANFKSLFEHWLNFEIDIAQYLYLEHTALNYLPKTRINAEISQSFFNSSLVLKQLFHFLNRENTENDLLFRSIGPIYDVSMHGSYLIKKRVQIFVNVNNILNQNFETWPGYETFGFNLQGGLTIAF